MMNEYPNILSDVSFGSLIEYSDSFMTSKEFEALNNVKDSQIFNFFLKYEDSEKTDIGELYVGYVSTISTRANGNESLPYVLGISPNHPMNARNYSETLREHLEVQILIDNICMYRVLRR